MTGFQLPVVDNPCKECVYDYREFGHFINGEWKTGFTRKEPSFQCRFCIPSDFNRFASKSGREREEIMYGTRTQVSEISQ